MKTIADLLRSKCIFCGYNGESYWKEKTHNKNCPWVYTGGLQERIEALPIVIKELYRFYTKEDEVE